MHMPVEGGENYVAVCPKCLGDGEIACPECAGDGCDACGGKGFPPCPRCGGESQRSEVPGEKQRLGEEWFASKGPKEQELLRYYTLGVWNRAIKRAAEQCALTCDGKRWREDPLGRAVDVREDEKVPPWVVSRACSGAIKALAIDAEAAVEPVLGGGAQPRPPDPRPLDPRPPDHDFCPVCGERFKSQCRCMRGDRVCSNGHRWHLCPVHGSVETPKGVDTHKAAHDECVCGAAGQVAGEVEAE